jgi:hypothetical protein
MLTLLTVAQQSAANEGEFVIFHVIELLLNNSSSQVLRKEANSHKRTRIYYPMQSVLLNELVHPE